MLKISTVIGALVNIYLLWHGYFSYCLGIYNFNASWHPLVSWVKNLSINHYASDLACFFQWFGQFLQSIFQTKFKNEHSIARQWHSVRVMTRHFCLTMVELPKPYLIYFSGFFPALFANISKVLYPFFFHFSSSIFTPPLVSHLSSPLLSPFSSLSLVPSVHSSFSYFYDLLGSFGNFGLLGRPRRPFSLLWFLSHVGGHLASSLVVLICL